MGLIEEKPVPQAKQNTKAWHGRLELGGVSGGYGQTAGQNQQQSLQQSQSQSRRTESTTTVFLLVYFSEQGVVSDYRLSATKF